MLPSETSVLIVGAGPTGLAAAISLAQQGIKDFIIVDAILEGQNSSRASAVHAATLEALDTIGCAGPIISKGMIGKGMMFKRNTASFAIAEMEELTAYTRFPYVLLVPQYSVEEVLNAKLRELGVQVVRPLRVVAMKSCKEHHGLEVSFETGEVIRARYVIGADGKQSAVRRLAGISYTEPDSIAVQDSVAQLVIADVIFSPSKDARVSKSYITGNISPAGVFLTIPMPPQRDPVTGQDEDVVKIIFNVPRSSGPPPSNPPLSYIQEHIDMQGPPHLSSDSTVNPQPIHITKTVWSTRYKLSSAVAEQFVKRIHNEDGSLGGTMIVIGDAGHTHSPMGGQGMNLGLRDAILLGPVLRKSVQDREEKCRELEEWGRSRRSRALNTIRTTKTLAHLTDHLISPSSFVAAVAYWTFWLLTRISFVKRMSAWRLSGLGNV
ncbi:FAD/NAD-P-binding domain-containing protein [Armillaria solidipes]|uniref:FAD/NAD-P-binding domain-containing protein n=1 Tax=Armillaria solidipes TaxID=1076256 RepID=A0A2H3C4I3_9AGAR|nr:FAD/NAD-P-binding domain-containing protein [Armillaria solidipes]